MPYDEVMHKYKHGELRSGSGAKVTSREQAIAIMLSEKRAAARGRDEYARKRAARLHRRHRKLVEKAQAK